MRVFATRLAQILAPLVALLACPGMLVGVTAAAGMLGPRPVIVSLSVTPRVLRSTGGEITITAQVRYADACALYFQGLGAPRRLNCSSGRLSYRQYVPADAHPGLRSLYVVGYSGRRRTRSRDVEIEVLPASLATVPTSGIESCTAGPECDYGPIHETFLTYGNTGALGDCTFAAAADWEQILVGDQPEPEQIVYEFNAAGGTESDGLSQAAFMSYWMRDGIEGVKATGFEALTTTPADVRNDVRNSSALIVELGFAQGTYFGSERMTAGTHEAVVDGFTRQGPLVVTWGTTVQMSWEQWKDEVIGLWDVAAS